MISDATEKLDGENRARGLYPPRKEMPIERYDEIRRRSVEWQLVDPDTLSLDAARDMVVELRKANREFVAHANALIGHDWRRLVIKLLIGPVVILTAAVVYRIVM